MNSNLKTILSSFNDTPISDERKAVLRPLTHYIVDHMKAGKQVRLNFICTHNSRRSQISQVWAQTLAFFYDLPIIAYSGGVEITAFNPRAVEALARVGFTIVNRNECSNPTYLVYNSKGGPAIIGFSKLYDDPSNDCEEFAAIMTCDHADNNCPFIPGASIRIPVKYKDPKWADDSEQEHAAYDKTVLEIGKELNYAFNQVKLYES